MAISQQRILRNLEEKYATGGLNPNQLDDTGLSLLHKFAFDGYFTCFKWLLKHGADPFVRSKEGSVAAHYASASGNLQILQCLHEAHPDCLDIKDLHGTSALYIAAQEGQLDCLIWLAKNSGLLGSEPAVDGMTAVHAAAQEGHLDCVRYLVQFAHCSALQRDKAGCTPLHFAAAEGHWKVVKWLIEHGGVTGEEQDKTGSTPLHLASECGKLRGIKVMLKLGVSPLLKDTDGKIPVEIARDFGHNDCVSFFIQFMTHNRKPVSASEFAMGLKKVRFNEKNSQKSQSSSSSYTNWLDISNTRINDFLGQTSSRKTSFPWEDSMDLEFDFESLEATSTTDPSKRTPIKRNNSLRSKRSSRALAYNSGSQENSTSRPRPETADQFSSDSQKPDLSKTLSNPNMNSQNGIVNPYSDAHGRERSHNREAHGMPPDILQNIITGAGGSNMSSTERGRRRLPTLKNTTEDLVQDSQTTREHKKDMRSKTLSSQASVPKIGAPLNHPPRLQRPLSLTEKRDGVSLTASPASDRSNVPAASSSMFELNSSNGIPPIQSKEQRSQSFIREKDPHPKKQIKLPSGYKGIVNNGKAESKPLIGHSVDWKKRERKAVPLQMPRQQPRAAKSNNLGRYSQFYKKEEPSRSALDEHYLIKTMPLPPQSGKYGDNIEEAVSFFSYNLNPKKKKSSKAWTTIKHNLSSFFSSLRTKRRGKSYESESSFWTDFDGSYRFSNEVFNRANTVADVQSRAQKKTSLKSLFQQEVYKGSGEEKAEQTNGVRRISQLQPGYSVPALSHVRSMALDKSLKGRPVTSPVTSRAQGKPPQDALEKFVSRKGGTGFELNALKLNLADNPKETGNALIW